MKRLILASIRLASVCLLTAPAWAQAPQQCVSNALAGGTSSAITIPQQPCALSTNLLILTASAANPGATTLRMGGGPALPVQDSQGNALSAGVIPGAGAVVLLTSTGTAWKIVSGNATTGFTGTLGVANGGTGLTTIPTNGIMIGEGTGAVSTVSAGATGQFLGGNTASPPSWKTISTSLVSSWSAGTTGLTPSSPTTGAITLAGTLVPANGGTGIASYTVGDTLYASGSTTLSALADVATGNALISGGVAGAPSWGKIGLATHVSGTLGVGNGGSGAGSFTSNGVIYGSGASPFGVTAAGTNGTYLKGNTGSAPSFGTLASDTVTTVSLGTTGLTPSSPTAGAVTVAGTLVVGNGGTGAASFTSNGLLYGAAASPLAATVAGTTGQILVGVTGSAPVFTSVPASGVSTIGFGTTGLTPSAATGGVVTVAGTLGVPNGGTGAATLTGALVGNGTSAVTAGTLSVPNGGTGGTSFTVHGVLVGETASPLAVTAAGATGQYFKGSTGADPVWGTLASDTVSTVSFGSTGLTPNSATAGAVVVAGTLGVGNGGTGQTSYTDGQLLIGNTTGNTLAKATVTAGTGITVTNGSGTITIASSVVGGITWGGAPKTTSFSANANTSYCIDTLTTGALAMTLPTTPADGTQVLFRDCKSNFSVANFTVTPGGSDSIMGTAGNMLVSTSNASSALVYSTTLADWRM